MKSAVHSIRDVKDRDWWVPTPNARASLSVIGCSQYAVTATGKIINLNSREPLKPYIDKRGYHNYSLWKDNGTRQTVRVHRLVAMAFVRVPKGLMPRGGTYDDLDVNHIDMNPNNNNYWNLEWCLPVENLKASLAIRDQSMKFLPDPLVVFICQLIMDKFRNKPISKALGISETRIQDIRRKRSYPHITHKYEFPLTHDVFRCLSAEEHVQQEEAIRQRAIERFGTADVLSVFRSDHSEDRTIFSPAVAEEPITDLGSAATDVAASS